MSMRLELLQKMIWKWLAQGQPHLGYAIMTSIRSHNSSNDCAVCIAVSKSTNGCPHCCFEVIQMASGSAQSEGHRVWRRHRRSIPEDGHCRLHRTTNRKLLRLLNPSAYVTGGSSSYNFFQEFIWSRKAASIPPLPRQSCCNSDGSRARNGFRMTVSRDRRQLRLLSDSVKIISKICTQRSHAHCGTVAIGTFTTEKRLRFFPPRTRPATEFGEQGMHCSTIS